MSRYRRALTAAALGLALVLLGACASTPRGPRIALPPLRLAPAALGQELAQQQQLEFRFGSQRRALIALLEVDATEVRLAVEALGQSGVRLRWDGHALDERRAPWLPAAVRGARVLDDIQFVLWPAPAIAAALPPGWTLEADAGSRRLVSGGVAWLSARYAQDEVVLDNAAEDYALRIRAVGLGEVAR